LGLAIRYTGLILAFFACGFAQGQDETFDITRFEVEGNTLLAPAQVDALIAPYAGHKRVYGDIQKALEALENAYRSSGYGTVQVYVPEQELTLGIVKLRVTEGTVAKVAVTGNKFFDIANVRNTLPDLKEGKAPNMSQLSENIQLANENPAKQIEVTLGVGETEGTVNAKVNVADENPEKYILTVDNTGTAATGNHRIGFAYQNANIGNSDQVLTLAYTTSPDAPQGVKVDIFSLAYRVPFYSIGDSVDLIYGKSSVNTPMTTAGPGTATLNGKGDVFGLRWNHYFPRRGEYTSKLIAGVDYKYINTRCTNPATGADFLIDPPTLISPACTPYTLRPVSLTYTGQRQSPGQLLDYSLGIVHNVSMGNNYDYTIPNGPSGNDRYSGIATRQVPNDFSYYKTTFNYLHALPQDWAIRAALNAQYSDTALPNPEQIGIAGATAVRGFNERAVAGDKGFFVNLEVYTPELAALVGVPGSLKALGFYDFGRSISYNIVRNADLGQGPFEKAGIASVGFGLRYAIAKDFSFKLDFARVVDAGPADIVPGTFAGNPSNTESRGDWRGHFGLQLAF
jgi:hemolysin activation/secretion protein